MNGSMSTIAVNLLAIGTLLSLVSLLRRRPRKKVIINLKVERVVV
ncbi:MAG: hypothetical protein QXD46_00070 [Thermofilum sp.]